MIDNQKFIYRPPNERELSHLMKIIGELSGRIENNENCDEILETLNNLLIQEVDESIMSICTEFEFFDEFVDGYLRPYPKELYELNDEELLFVIKKIISFEWGDYEILFHLRIIEKNTNSYLDLDELNIDDNPLDILNKIKSTGSEQKISADTAR